MKKIFFFFTPFLFVLCFSFSVNAEAMPSISNSTFELIEGGENRLTNLYSTYWGIFSSVDSDIMFALQDLLGIDPKLQPSDYHIRPLSEIEKEDLEAGFIRHFYDDSGNEIPLDDLYYVSANNGYYTAEFYIDSSGNVLFDDPYQSNYLINVGLNPLPGVTGSSFSDWDDVMQHLSDEIKENNFNFSPDSSDLTDNAYLIWFGETSYYRPAWSCYMLIPNQYNPGVIVPSTNTNNAYIGTWYCNDLSAFTYKDVLGTANQLRVSEGNYSKNGFSYHYYVEFAPGRGFGGFSPDDTYNNWIQNGQYGALFVNTGSNYNASKFEESSRFINVKASNVPFIDLDEMYSYDELQNLQPEAVPDLNPDFDPSLPLSPDNWPQSFPLPSTNPLPSVLPLPGSSPIINPAPSPGDIIGDITPTTPIPTDIPILSNLKNRFPFSIPFDLYRLAKSFSAERLTPIFDLSFTIPIINYDVVVSFDLTPWNGLFSLFRTLELIIFIGGLAVFSYEHFFGS